MVLLTFLSFGYTFLQFIVFCTVWTIFIAGVFVVVRLLLSAHLCSTICNLIAFAISSSLIFQLVTLYGKYAAARKMIMERGPPMDCMGFFWIIRIFSSHSCSDYYEALQGNIFWQLNVVHVSATFLRDTLTSIASMFGVALGEFLQSFISRLDWLLRLPIVVVVTLCVPLSLLALFHYRFDLFYGLIRADFRKKLIARQAESVPFRNDVCEIPTGKFIEYRRTTELKPLLVVNELYQKLCYRTSFQKSK